MLLLIKQRDVIIYQYPNVNGGQLTEAEWRIYASVN